VSTPDRPSPYSWAGNPPPPVTVSLLDIGGGKQLATGPGVIIAVTTLNQGATTAFKFYLRDGTDATGNVLAAFQVPAGDCRQLAPGEPGIPFANGVYADEHIGQGDVTLTYIPLYQGL